MVQQFSSPWPNHYADIIPALFYIQFVITLSFVIFLYLDTEIKNEMFHQQNVIRHVQVCRHN